MDRVAKPAEYSAIGNRKERPTFMRGNAESSAKGGARGSGAGLPAPQSNRHQPSPYRRNLGSGVCKIEAGGDALAKSQCGAAG